MLVPLLLLSCLRPLTLPLRLTLWCGCFHLSTCRVPAGGGCLPTEPHGLVFQDMGFTVYEHIFWDSARLCLDPSMLLDVVEVDVLAQKHPPRLDSQFPFPFPPPSIIKAFSRLGFVAL